MPYWKFEAFIERLNNRNAEIAKKQKAEAEAQKAAQKNSGGSNMNASSMMNRFRNHKF